MRQTKLCLMLLFAMATCVLWSASAQAPPDPNSPEERQKRWKRVLYWKQRVRLLSLKRKEGSLLDAIESFDRQQVVLMRRLQRSQEREEVLRKEVQQRLKAWQLQQKISRERLKKMQPRLRTFYRFVRLGRARLLMGARSLRTLAQRWRALHLTTQQDLALLREYQSIRHKARDAARKWKKKQAAHKAMMAQIKRNQAEVRKQRREKAITLQALYKEVHVYRRVLKELRGSGQQLRQMLEKWQLRAPSGGLSMLKGQLPWPIRRFTGRCLQYKLKVSGSFRALRCLKKAPSVLPLKSAHQRPGVAIAVPEGTPVQAVAAGRVAHRGWIRGYGQVLLIEHGQKFFSLYAHLSSMMFQVKQTVNAGQIIGLSGSTGMLGKPVLYFELRHHARVLSSKKWLMPLR